MDTRRPPTANTGKPFARKNYYKKDGEQRAYNPDRKYQPRDNRYQSRDNRYQDKDNRYQDKDNRYQGRDNRSQENQQRDDRYPKRNGRFFQKNDRFQPKGKRFQPNGKFQKPWEKINKPRIVSDMQVTDGKHRGKYLATTASPKIRPTPRRTRETMFKILFRRIRAGRFLDLCAGCGMVGIEAISRGALLGTFVERSAKMCSFIKKNLETCGIKEGHGEVVELEAVPFLKQMAKRRRFWDVVFFDPPYDSDYEEALKYFARGTAIKPNGVLVIEHHSEMFFPERIGVLKRWRVIIHGDTAISFYERKS